MPSTLLCCGLLLLLPVPFVSTDPQSYNMEDDVESGGGAGGGGYMSYFFNAPERYRSLPEPSLTREDTRASWHNLASMGNRQFDDIRQAITAAWSGGGGVSDKDLLARGRSAMDDDDDGDGQDQEQLDQEQDEDDEAEADDQQRTVDNDYDSRIGQFAQNKRSSPGKRLQFNQDMRQHYMRMFTPNGRGGMSGGGGGGGIDGGVGAKMRGLKRERHGGGGGGGGTTLSVESPMDLIRQRLMQELRRRELVQKQRQIQTNEELLSTIGKRNGRQIMTVPQPPPPPPPPPPSSSAFISRLSFAPN